MSILVDLWAICITQHNILYSSLANFIFSRNMLLIIKFIADWEAIKIRKQNNDRENNLSVDFDYKVDDKVLVTSKYITRKLKRPTKCPFRIIQVHPKGTDVYRVVHCLKG